jgi:hypothetical protein
LHRHRSDLHPNAPPRPARGVRVSSIHFAGNSRQKAKCMPRHLPETIALRTLKGEQVLARSRITRDQAIDLLKRITGQDFGDDADRWAACLRILPRHLRHAMAEERSGVVRGMLPSGEASIELEDGEMISAIIPRTVLRRMCIVTPGMAVRVRVREVGCSQVIGTATKSD